MHLLLLFISLKKSQLFAYCCCDVCLSFAELSDPNLGTYNSTTAENGYLLGFVLCRFTTTDLNYEKKFKAMVVVGDNFFVEEI